MKNKRRKLIEQTFLDTNVMNRGNKMKFSDKKPQQLKHQPTPQILNGVYVLYIGNTSLSNYLFCDMKVDDTYFQSLESAYQYKRTEPNDKLCPFLKLSMRNIFQQMKGYDALSIGLYYEDQPQFVQKRLYTMLQLLRIKFSSKSIKNDLLKTQEAVLIYNNYHHDNYWGRCQCEDCKQQPSMNYLGLLLAIIREELKESVVQIDTFYEFFKDC